MYIKINNLSKSYDSPVFVDFSASIEPGHLLGVLGVNGAGKTTLLEMLAGLTGYEKGEILFNGELAKRDDPAQRRRFYYIPDFPILFKERNTLENIAIALKLWQVTHHSQEELNEKILTYLEDFDLLSLANKPIYKLSRGQAFKVALVILITVDPELWLIDEPFASGMDPQGIAMFKKYTREAIARQRTVIYTTQLLELAEKFSDRIWVIHQGHLIADNSAEELQGKDASLEHLFTQFREK